MDGAGNLNVTITVPDNLMFDLYFNGLEKRLRGIVFRVMRDAKTYWRTEAGKRLKSSRKWYMGSITSERIAEDEMVIKMTGWAVMLEVGTPGFDMKENLLKGRYSRVVPLNLQTEPAPGTKGRDYFVNWPFVNARVFRTVTATSQGWQYPSKPGAQILPDVIYRIENYLLPKYINEVLDS